MAKKTPTPLLRRQRELAWLLYIGEGAAGNFEHALAVNCVTFEPKDAAAVRSAISAIERANAHIRNRLGNLR